LRVSQFLALLSLGFFLTMSNQIQAQPILKKHDFADIAGWSEDNHAEALAAFQRSCVEIIATGHAFGRSVKFSGERSDWLQLCQSAQDTTNPRQFFEQNFTPLAVTDPVRPGGLFTGYFEPEAPGSFVKTKEFNVPIYRKPHDLTSLDADAEKRLGLKYGRVLNGEAEGYFTRAEIENGALKDRGLEIIWLRDWADAFFIHIQGSGRIRLPDGTALRLAYSAKTGQPYTGIGGVLVERGILTKETMSMQGIRAWMRTDPKAARELMQLNKSFIFFRSIEVKDETLGAPGGQYVQLSPLRSLAVDRSIWVFGTPLWIDTTTPPDGPGGAKTFRRLMIAQDTGTAIKGHVRGDVYWGWGEIAAEMAGRMKSQGQMIALLPNAIAQRLLDNK
jgi:membrane-bound lytic murein transglycosylase A